MSEKNYAMTIELNENALVVMDTNVWLKLYTYAPSVLKILCDAIETKKEYFWMPNQVKEEFDRHSEKERANIVKLVKKEKGKIKNKIDEAHDQVKLNLQYMQNKFLKCDTEIFVEVENKFDELKDLLKERYDEYEKKYENEIKCIKEDIVADIVGKIYDNSKADSFTYAEKMNICMEGEFRYKYKIAPGFTDDDKEVNADNYHEKFGDLIIWKEILRKVQGTGLNVIFVCEEKKRDWLGEKGGTKLASNLIKEYADATFNKGIIEVCDLTGFIKLYGNKLNIPPKSENEIVDLLRYVNEASRYILEKSRNIAWAELEDLSNDDVFDEIMNQIDYGTIFGGVYFKCDNQDIEEIDVISSFVYNEGNSFILVAEFEVAGGVTVTEEYHRRNYLEGDVLFRAVGDIRMEIQISSFDKDYIMEKCYTVINKEVSYRQLQIENEDELTCVLQND